MAGIDFAKLQQPGYNMWTDKNTYNLADPQANLNYQSQIASSGGNDLYNADTFSKLQSMFSPYFNQQKSELYQTLKNEQGFLGQQAGANAAAQGLANPGAYSSSAQSRLTSSFAPAFSQLQTNQTGQLLGATANSSQFNQQNMNNLLQFGLQQQQINQQPDIWTYLLSGLLGAGGQLGAAALKG